VFRLAISRVPVYTAISIPCEFVFSTLYVCISIRIYAYVYGYLYVCMCIYMCIYIYMHVYVCVYIYMYMSLCRMYVQFVSFNIGE